MLDQDQTQGGAIAKRQKPELVLIGDKFITSNGRWNDEIMVNYVKKHALDKWVPVGELARVAWGANTIANKKRARSYLGRLFRLMLEKGQILSVEYGGDRGAATEVKLYDPKNETERNGLQKKLERLEKYGILNAKIRKSAEDQAAKLDRESGVVTSSLQN